MVLTVDLQGSLSTYCVLSVTHMPDCRSDPALQGPAVQGDRHTHQVYRLTEGERLRVGVHRGGCVRQVVMVSKRTCQRGRVGCTAGSRGSLGML